eukprot:2538299-Rhodomonas_salina.2
MLHERHLLALKQLLVIRLRDDGSAPEGVTERRAGGGGAWGRGVAGKGGRQRGVAEGGGERRPEEGRGKRGDKEGRGRERCVSGVREGGIGT